MNPLRETIVAGTSQARKEFARLFEVASNGRRALHVVVADNVSEDELIVITVYEPDIGQWEPGFRWRRP